MNFYIINANLTLTDEGIKPGCQVTDITYRLKLSDALIRELPVLMQENIKPVFWNYLMQQMLDNNLPTVNQNWCYPEDYENGPEAVHDMLKLLHQNQHNKYSEFLHHEQYQDALNINFAEYLIKYGH